MINLKLREEALLAKCLGRRICSECGANYNVACIDIKGDDDSPRMYMPPLLPPPDCESKLISRADDTEEVVKERLRIYNKMVKKSSSIFFHDSNFHRVNNVYICFLFHRLNQWRNSTRSAGSYWNLNYPVEFQSHGQGSLEHYTLKMINSLQ